jgi:hypothetical protein
MKTTFPSLASLLLAFLTIGAGGQDQPAGNPPPSPTAEETLQAAIREIDRYESIVAKVRQRAALLGKELVGSGTYVQGPVRYNLVRLELSLRVDDKQTTLLQICDGKQLWTHRDLWGETKLTCLDAQRVLAALQRNEAAQKRAAVEGLALGGLPRILRELQRCFQFDEVLPSKLGSLPVRVLKGHWRTDRLKTMLPDQAEAIAAGSPADLSRLRAHLPDEVLLYVGRDDLFPYRVEYRRTTDNHMAAFFGDTHGPAILFALEFYEVRVNSPVDPLQFVFTPGTARFEDQTDAYIAGHGL